MTHAIRLFGTEEPSSEGRRIRTGRLSATLQDGNLRHVRFDGIEIIRAVSCVVRDHEWGTADVLDAVGPAGRPEAVTVTSTGPNRIAGLGWREDREVRLLLDKLTSDPLDVLMEGGRDRTTISLGPFETRGMALSD